MIYINVTYTRRTPVSEDEILEEKGFKQKHEPVTFRELVELLQTHNEPSCFPLPAGNLSNVWFTDHYANDGTAELYEQNTIEETCLHFSGLNKPYKEKYWRKAIQIARAREY